MKRLFSFNLLFLIVFCLPAQNITISFQPKVTGNQIDTIWVTNQRTLQKAKLIGSESLQLTFTTGIDLIRNVEEDGYLYPNPGYGNATLVFSNSRDQNVMVSVYNMAGQVLGINRQLLSPGQHSFKLKFPIDGLYTVSVQTNDKRLSMKAAVVGGEIQECKIDYAGSDGEKIMKNALTGKTMDYMVGDILLYSVHSGNNNAILTDSPTADKVYTVDFFECKDMDGQHYPIVKIGNQVWMAKNLAYLPTVSLPSRLSYYDKDYFVYGYSGTDVSAAKATSNYSTYGVLYNMPAAKYACPSGWHLPSDDEWTILQNYLKDNGYLIDVVGFNGGNGISLAASTGWALSTYNGSVGDPNYIAYRNKSGFSALPAGVRSHLREFVSIGSLAYWWSSTVVKNSLHELEYWYRALSFMYSSLGRNNAEKYYGYSVRCVKD